MSPAQFIALAHLIGLETLPQGELASLLGITPASAVRLIDRMERDGWVKRLSDPRDRRVKLVEPTEEALAEWEQLSSHPVDLLQQAYQGISDDDIKNTIRTLTRIRRNLGGE